MDSEQILLNMFKQQHYNETQQKMQKTILILSLIASAFGTVLMIFFYSSMIYIYAIACSTILAGTALLLAGLKTLSYNVASFGYMLFACFVLVPVMWHFTGITGATPYMSLVMLVGILSMFSGRMLKGMLYSFLGLLVVLAVYSILFEIPAGKEHATVIYNIVGLMFAAGLITSYILSKLKHFEQLNDRFLRSSFKDELTLVYNRKLLDIIMQYEEKLYSKEKSDYILVMFDIDNFKQMNDEHGHIFGDVVLRNVAQCLSDKVRDSDFVVRYGGDEFLIVQTRATDASLSAFTDRIDAAIEASCYMEIEITASYGFAARSECDSAVEVLTKADQRLYEMKNRQGKRK